MDLKGTQTAENLRKALAGESIARNKYTYFAQAAQAAGEEEIAAAFEQMAKNEMMHAKFWFELLYGRPADPKECLTQAAMGEYSEWHDMYPGFAAQAREEGLEEIALMFEKVAAIERSHEGRFMTLLAQMTRTEPEQAPGPARQEGSAPRQKKTGYRCQFCGAVFEKRPDVCDVCQAIGAFELVDYYE